MQDDTVYSKRIDVPQAFENVFSHFYYAHNTSGSDVRKILLPGFQTILVFGFGKPAFLQTKENTQISVDKSIILGPLKQPFDYVLPAGTSILVASFKDDAFFRFFGGVYATLPLHPDHLLEEDCFTNLWYHIATLPTPEEQVKHILDFCAPYLKDREALMQFLPQDNDQSINSVKVAAASANQTERNIQLQHKKILGYSAKEIARYKRFLSAIEHVDKKINAQQKIDWFDIIADCGYYDQSQLIHDFKQYIHLSPTQYLKFQQEICRA